MSELNDERVRLILRLNEARFSARVFVKLADDNKQPYERNWPNKPYTPEEMVKSGCPTWGIFGQKNSDGDWLIWIDTDKPQMVAEMRKILPSTFEVQTPRKKGVHFAIIIKNIDLDKDHDSTIWCNAVLQDPNDKSEKLEGMGEIRAWHLQVVSAGTRITYEDPEIKKQTSGIYKIIADRQFATMTNEEFTKIITPYLGSDSSQKLTYGIIRSGVSKGMRHHMGIRLANYLVYVTQLDFASALEAMKLWNSKCQPPLEEKELENMLNNAIRHGTSKQTTQAEEDDKKKKDYEFVVSGRFGGEWFEAVRDEKECISFLVKTKDGFKTVRKFIEKDAGETGEDLHICPKEVLLPQHENCGDTEYGIYNGETLSKQTLYDEVYSEFRQYLDVPDFFRKLLAVTVLVSYQQEKFATIFYIFVYGDNDCGKTTVLKILNQLCYRPMLGTAFNGADIYGYIEDVGCPPTILEDEAEGVEEDIFKKKIYKNGDIAGGVVPRTLMTEKGREMRYYPVFCLKVANAVDLPSDRGLLRRFILIPMVEGKPQKRWTDNTEDDWRRLKTLRNKLLKWRLETREETLPNVETKVTGGLRDHWKPLLQIVAGLPCEMDFKKQLEEQAKQRDIDRKISLDGHIVEAVGLTLIDKIIDQKNTQKQKTLPHGIEEIEFPHVWNKLKESFDLTYADEKKPYLMSTSEFGEITKSKVGKRIHDMFGAETDKRNKKVYVAFDLKKVIHVLVHFGFKDHSQNLLKNADLDVIATLSEFSEKDDHQSE